jgi:hypothetical protein
MEVFDRTSGFATWVWRISGLIILLIGLHHGYYKVFDHTASAHTASATSPDAPQSQELDAHDRDPHELDPKGAGLANAVQRDRVALRKAHGAAQSGAAMTQLAADQAKAVAWSRFYSPAPECAQQETVDREAECKERYQRAAQDFDKQYKR